MGVGRGVQEGLGEGEDGEGEKDALQETSSVSSTGFVLWWGNAYQCYPQMYSLVQ